MAPLPEHSAVMRALVYSGKGKVDLVQKPLPQVQDATDAVVKMTRTTICGTDLHIIRGKSELIWLAGSQALMLASSYGRRCAHRDTRPYTWTRGPRHHRSGRRCGPRVSKGR